MEKFNPDIHLGEPPKFEIGQQVCYQFAGISKVGYWETDRSKELSDRVFEVVRYRQAMIGLPVMKLVWEYEIVEVSKYIKSLRLVLLEPQLKLVQIA